MKELLIKTREYLDYIEEHYNNVQIAWDILKKECSDMRFIYDDFVYWSIDSAVTNHDKSKLSKFEFIQYRQKFFPTTEEMKNMGNKDFENAWKHHKKENDHHWETWSVELQGANGIYADMYIAHNVIDWMAMGMKFGDTAQSYYEKNKSSINIPDWAEKFMYEIFERIKEKTK